jgi:hypothetical protein
MGLFLRALCGRTSFAAAALFTFTAAAQALFFLAENKVPVAVVQVIRTPQFTELHLKPQQPVTGVCWYATGPNSPYLIANGRRYHFLSGDSITACPTKRAYEAQEVMVLRFQPVDSQVSEFSLVEGEGGENQMVDPKSSNETFWNFLHIRSN